MAYETADGMHCELNHADELYFACAEHPGFLTTVTYYRIPRPGPLVTQFEAVDWTAEPQVEDGMMVVHRSGEFVSVGTSASPAVVRFEELIVDAMSEVQRDVREEASTTLECDGCLNGEYCEVRHCANPTAEEFCGESKDTCQPIKLPGNLCSRDAECPSACIGIRGRCE